MLVELWQKGLIWDNVIGYKLIQVDQLFQGQLAAHLNGYTAATGPPTKFHVARWFTLDADLLVAGGLDHPAIIGTKNPTPYMVLLDLRWELTSSVGERNMLVDHGGSGLIDNVQRPFGGGLGHLSGSSVDNYNNTFDSYGIAAGCGIGSDDMCGDYGQPYDQQQQQQPAYNNSEMYSSTTAYNGLDADDALYNRHQILPGGSGNGYDDTDASCGISYQYGNCEYH